MLIHEYNIQKIDHTFFLKNEYNIWIYFLKRMNMKSGIVKIQKDRKLKVINTHGASTFLEKSSSTSYICSSNVPFWFSYACFIWHNCCFQQNWTGCCFESEQVFKHFSQARERKKERNEGLRVAALGEFLDVSQFQVGNEEKHQHHGGQSHVVLPQAPGGVLYPQVVKVLLSCAPGTHMHSHRIKGSRSQFLFSTFSSTPAGLLTSGRSDSRCCWSPPPTRCRFLSRPPRKTSNPQTRWSSRPEQHSTPVTSTNQYILVLSKSSWVWFLH